MRQSPVAVAVLAVFAVFGPTTAVHAQPAQRTPAPARQNPVFLPGFDDLMTMLVQPRHVKLYYAGTQKNWELAAAQLRDLRSAFERIAAAIPSYQGNDVNASVKSLIAPQMAMLEKAIAAADRKKFALAYDNLTSACNACHTYMEHPFIVIRTPQSPQDVAYPDQDFKAAP